MTTATIVADIDNHILKTLPTTNRGGFGYVAVDVDWSGGEKIYLARAIGNFDLSSIPAGATIDSAVLRQDIYNASGSRAAFLFRLVRADWEEMSSTWDNYKTLTAWTSGGAGDDGADHTTVDQVAFTFPASTGAFDITGMKTLVEDAIANRSDWLRVMMRYANELEDAGSDEHYWRSSEYTTDEAERWRLVVEYTGGAVAASRRSALVQAA